MAKTFTELGFYANEEKDRRHPKFRRQTKSVANEVRHE